MFSHLDVDEIRDSLDAELQVASHPIMLTVESCARLRDVWQVTVKEDDAAKTGLDEALEGNTAWWAEPSRGHADVLSVVPEQALVNLRFVTAPLPGEGQTLFVYPPRYLEQLKRAWDEPSWAKRCLEWLNGLGGANDSDERFAGDPRLYPQLRPRQRDAFNLTRWRTGFLWGPPGTGKTYTLGALLATYLVDRPSNRVLLLSSTNAAVDQVLLSVDKALESLGSAHSWAPAARRKCARVGAHFVASSYAGREHLLPANDVQLVRALTQLEASKPEVADAVAYAMWKRSVEKIRAEMRAAAKASVQSAQLAAMTTTSAAYRLDDLRSALPFDLIVFDEASQVSVAYAACLAPLGRRALIAGDPQQLAPVVRTQKSGADRWLGRSPFELRPLRGPETCRLNEQSRMIGDICDVVSGTFYDGELKVAADCAADQAWLTYRGIRDVPPIGAARAVRMRVPSSGTYSQKYAGWIRYDSAVAIVELAKQLAEMHGDRSLVILTPFRAQRALIKMKLRFAGLRGVAVSTVHRAQGSERHTVIFDPVDGAGRFVREHDRLLNVAISRAQARLIVAASDSDLQNPTIRRITDLMSFSQAPKDRRAAPELKDIAQTPGFPAKYIGTIVAIGTRSGRLELVSPDQIVLTDTVTASHVKYKTILALPGYTGTSVGQLPQAELSARDWADFGGPRERQFRERLKELEKIRLEYERQIAEGERAGLRTHEPPAPSTAREFKTSSSQSETERLIRSRMSALANAPLRPSRSDAEPPTSSSIRRRARRGRCLGIVVQCEGNSGGLITARDGRHYAFAFVDLSPGLKLKGIQEGLKVHFDKVEHLTSHGIGRATNISE